MERTLLCWPSPLSSGWAPRWQSGPPGRSPARNTTSYTGLNLQPCPGRCLVSCCRRTQRRDQNLNSTTKKIKWFKHIIPVFYRSTCDTVRSLPLNIVHQSSLQQQVPFGEEVVADQILIGSHCHPVTDAEGTQHIQNLREQKEQSDASGFFCLQIKPVFIYAMSERDKTHAASFGRFCFPPCGCARACRAERWWIWCALSGWCSEPPGSPPGYSGGLPGSLRHLATETFVTITTNILRPKVKCLSVNSTWRWFQSLQFADQPVQVTGKLGAVVPVPTDQRGWGKEEQRCKTRRQHLRGETKMVTCLIRSTVLAVSTQQLWSTGSVDVKIQTISADRSVFRSWTLCETWGSSLFFFWPVSWYL